MADAGLRKSNYDLYSEWNDVYNGRTNANLLIMGSSRSWVHISPFILDDVLKVNSYNLGMDGWSFSMQSARFKVFLKHNRKPDYVIQSLDMGTLDKREDLYQYQQFLPYLSDPIIWSATQKYKGKFTLTQYYFPLFKYNGNWNLVIIGLLNYFGAKADEPLKYKGQQGQDSEWDNSFDKYKKDNPNGVKEKIDGETKVEFENYLNYCKENGIKVALVYTPEYYEAQQLTINREEVMEIYRSYAAKFDIPFLDYSNHPISFNKSYFYNSQHMNKNGAEIFSKILAQDLLNIDYIEAR